MAFYRRHCSYLRKRWKGTPLNSLASSSYFGAKALQWPHQGAYSYRYRYTKGAYTQTYNHTNTLDERNEQTHLNQNVLRGVQHDLLKGLPNHYGDLGGGVCARDIPPILFQEMASPPTLKKESTSAFQFLPPPNQPTNQRLSSSLRKWRAQPTSPGWAGSGTGSDLM